MNRRCFVALDLPDKAREAACGVQRSLREKFPDLRYTSRENLHLTLKFLGEISSGLLEEAGKRLKAVQGPPLEVSLGPVGAFPPSIVWLRLKGADDFQRQVDDALAPLFEPETRFMGHVTIARTKDMPDSLRRALEVQESTELAARAVSFSLQESCLSHLGPRYETIARQQLQS